jgi:hypothetical protein
MSKLTEAVALSGALDPEQFRELAKWRLPVGLPEGDPFTSPEQATAAIEDATSGYDQVRIRVSDPDVMKTYLATKREGKLVLKDGDAKQSFDWSFGVTKAGDYLLQWGDNAETDLLTNGESYLLDGQTRVFFSDVQELYFGEKRVFLQCTVRK